MADQVDFAAEGLLTGLTGAARDSRLALLERLLAEGVSLGELREAAAENRLLLLPAERAIGGSPRYSGNELAERSGLEPEFLARMRRAHGLPVPDPNERIYTEDDLEGAHTARNYRDAGLDADDMVEITRILGRGLAQGAAAMRAVVLKQVLRPGATEDELAFAFADAAATLTPLTGPMLTQMMKLHLRHLVQTELLSAAEREAGSLPGAREINVGFADLVGFTRLGEELPPDELDRVAHRLEALAADAVRPPARVVKTIGDAAMIVSPHAPALIDAALDMVQAADAEGNEFPQLHVGLAAGEALSRAGDWFGRPVNLASRVTAIARPGSVLVTGEVREAAADLYAWSFAGKRRLRGVPDEVALFRARPPAAADSGDADGE